MTPSLPAAPLGCPLTPRQFAVLAQVADGRTYEQIARALGVSRSTIRTHAHSACRRLGVRTPVQAVGQLFRQGWVEAPPSPGHRPPPVTHFQRAYLDAFDQHLRCGSARSRRTMRIALYGARNEAGLEPALDRPPGRDPLLRLLADIVAI